MLDLKNFKFEYEPYPHGVAHSIFDNQTYKDLIDNFPDVKKLKMLKDKYEHKVENKFNKFALSSRNDPVLFFDLISSNNVYKKLVNYLLSYDFKINLLNILIKNNINLGVVPKKDNWKKSLRSFLLNFIPYNILRPVQDIDVAIEFSAIPIHGGYLKPHTDGPHKLASVVIPIIDDNWQDSFNGGTNLLKPKDNTRLYNILNNTYEFEECNIIKTIKFNPNQLLIFLKTYNSFHSVGPLNGKQEGFYRKSITLNIEKKIKY
jgi:hypothetical protein